MYQRSFQPGAYQPFLFEELNTSSHSDTAEFQKAGKSVVQKLLSLRKTLHTDSEKQLEVFVNQAIREIRAQTTLTRTQQESLILISIEKSKARHTSEISEDTRIPKEIVKEIVIDLVKQKVLRLVQYTVIGSPRKHFQIKSNRIKDVEAD